MPKAVWNDAVLAESDNTIFLENYHYFPPNTVRMEYFKKSGNQYHCPWKGVADYYNVQVSGKVNQDAAWSYPNPNEAAKEIKGFFSFWKGVEIID